MKKILSVLSILALFVLSANAQSTFPLFTTHVLASATSNAVTHAASVTLQPGKALAIWPNFVLNGASVENITFGFNCSPDNKVWSTTCPATVTIAANGTNGVVGFGILTNAVTDNARFIRFDRVINTTNALTITNITYRFQP